MSDFASAAVLPQECSVFSRYLAGIEATPYLVEAYTRGHKYLPALQGTPDALDQALLRFARRGPWCARLADAYARRARPTGILRQKLVLQLAVLESSPPAHAWINSADIGPVPIVLAGAAWAVGVSVLSLVAAIVVFGPLHLVAGLRPAGRAA